MTVVGHLARLALGAVLLFAALIKAADLALFTEQVEAYRILPALAPLLARGFVALELGLAGALLAGWRPRWTLPAAGALMVLFMSVIGWAWAHGYSGPCGCFGSRGSRGPSGALLEDGLFLLLALAGAWGCRRLAGDRPWQRAAALLGLTLGVVLPLAAPMLPIDGLVTDARAGRPFDHLVVEGFDGRIDDGRYLFALLDPEAPRSAAAVEPLNGLLDAAAGDGTEIVGIIEGDNEALVAFMFEHDPEFELGHAPRAALRRFYRTLPVFLEVDDGVVQSAWFGRPPAPTELASSSP